MALNSVQKNQSTMTVTQLLGVVSKAITTYGKREDLVTSVAILCTLVVMIGSVFMSTAMMVTGAVALVIAFAPAIIRWSVQDYNKEL